MPSPNHAEIKEFCYKRNAPTAKAEADCMNVQSKSQVEHKIIGVHNCGLESRKDYKMTRRTVQGWSGIRTCSQEINMVVMT